MAWFKIKDLSNKHKVYTQKEEDSDVTVDHIEYADMIINDDKILYVFHLDKDYKIKLTNGDIITISKEDYERVLRYGVRTISC